jgi:hypothetical protein
LNPPTEAIIPERGDSLDGFNKESRAADKLVPLPVDVTD